YLFQVPKVQQALNHIRLVSYSRLSPPSEYDSSFVISLATRSSYATRILKPYLLFSMSTGGLRPSKNIFALAVVKGVFEFASPLLVPLALSTASELIPSMFCKSDS